MSENGEVEVENLSYQVLPKDVTDEIGSVKLFNKWSYEDVEIRDISLTYVTAFLNHSQTRMLPYILVVRANEYVWTATTFKSEHPSISHTLPADMP